MPIWSRYGQAVRDAGGVSALSTLLPVGRSTAERVWGAATLAFIGIGLIDMDKSGTLNILVQVPLGICADMCAGMRAGTHLGIDVCI